MILTISESAGSLAENVGFEFFVFNSATVVFINNLEEGVDVLPLDRDLELGDEVGGFVNSEVAALVQIEIVEDLSKESRVTASQLENARLNFAEEVRDSLLGDLGVLFFGNLPGGFHHAYKVLVGGGAH
jgi:hypothetical protein